MRVWLFEHDGFVHRPNDGVHLTGRGVQHLPASLGRSHRYDVSDCQASPGPTAVSLFLGGLPALLASLRFGLPLQLLNHSAGRS